MSASLDQSSHGRTHPVRTLSPLSDDDAEVLEQNGIQSVQEFLDNADSVEGFLRDDEFTAAVKEAEMLTGGVDVTKRAYQEHAEWHDELVKGGHDPVTDIVSAEDIKQPAGRPRKDGEIKNLIPGLDDDILTALVEAGYEMGSDFNDVRSETVATETGLSVEEIRPIVEKTRTAYFGLPVLEDKGHPLIPDRDTYREIWTRRTLTGATDVTDVCYGAAQNEYPICLVGYPGVGKSYIFGHVCAMTNRPLISFDMDSSLRAEDVLGFHVPEDDGSVEFQHGMFPIAFRHGIWLNINELPAMDAGVRLAMHQMTERDAQIMLRTTGEKVEPHPAFRVTGTRNPNTDAFAGHSDTNEASTSRWEEIWVDYLPPSDEIALLNHMVNGTERHVSDNQLTELVHWAESFRPGVPDKACNPDASKQEALAFKQHVFEDSSHISSQLPRLSTRDLAQMCFKAARPGATLKRAAKAVVFHTCEPNRHDLEAALERAEDLSV